MAYTNLFPVHIITNGAMTGTAVVTSSSLDIKYYDNIGLQFHWTGTPNGTFVINISSDNSLAPVNWVALPVSPAVAATGSAGDVYVDINQTSAQWLQVVYTNSSSTGTLQVWAVGKMV
jgi:hypothetical protein